VARGACFELEDVAVGEGDLHRAQASRASVAEVPSAHGRRRPPGAVPRAEAVLEAPAAAGKLVDGLEVGEEAEALELDLGSSRASAREENLYVAGERLAARAASPATRRQYASIYRTFGDWLRGKFARPPTTADLTADVIAAFARHLETSGGRGGGPARPTGCASRATAPARRRR
ncbi:MAG: hypothetical protein WKF96_12855, partial [Solirubrobacteraceae bacterium]